MTVLDRDESELRAQEARENLRAIREMMERSTRHSTFSGMSGVLAGTFAIAGCLAQRFLVAKLPPESRAAAFVVSWGLVIGATLLSDYLLTKRHAAGVGKTIRSRLGAQIALASAPGLIGGILVTLYFLRAGWLDSVYPFWMLSYGSAVCAVGLFSQKEVSRLGWAFVAAGACSALLLMAVGAPARHELGLLMMAATFGGFHIAYGITVPSRDGWPS